MVGLLDKVLEKGRQNVETVLRDIAHEYDIRQDINVRPEALSVPEISLNPGIKIGGKIYQTTDYSSGQLLERAGMPRKYYEKLVKHGEIDLARSNIERMVAKVSPDSILVRAVDGVAKGILSSSYKRMDGSVLFQSFVKTVLGYNYLPLAGLNTQSRYHLKFVKNEIMPVLNDEVVYGLSITTSDYGASSLSINMFLMRVVCSNMMTATDVFRKVHLGSRFSGDIGDDGFVLSDRTMQMDSLTMASAVKDVLTSAVGYEKEIAEVINRNGSNPIDLKALIAKLRKDGKLTKPEAETATTVYEGELGVEYLPPQKNLWRFSNVLSLLAQSAEGDRKLELEKLSFDVME